MDVFHLYVLLAMGWVTGLALNISRTRIREQVGLGDGGRLPLKQAIRAHINALEHCVPFGLVLFALADRGTGESTLLVLAIGFLLSRVAHAVSIFRSLGNLRRASALGFYGFEVAALAILAVSLAP